MMFLRFKLHMTYIISFDPCKNPLRLVGITIPIFINDLSDLPKITGSRRTEIKAQLFAFRVLCSFHCNIQWIVCLLYIHKC